MRVIGGTFGVSGDAFINRQGELVIQAVKEVRFTGVQIKSLVARVEKEKKFGCFSFIIGAVILSLVLGLLLSIVGVVIGIILAAAMSFYSNSKNLVEVTFSTGDAVTLECTPRQVKKLVILKG